MPTNQTPPPHNPRRQGRGGVFLSSVLTGSAEHRKQLRKQQQEALHRQFHENLQAKRSRSPRPQPIRYQKPAFNTPAYWQGVQRGWITDEEQLEDQAAFETRRRRAVDSKHNQAAPPHRHERAAPRATKQFSKPMSTQAARDDRLTPQSKALLQVLVARSGKGRSTDTTKTTLGVIMNRCPRSIQRYLRELVKFGYIRTQTRKSRRTGFFVGLRIWIMNCVLPFFAQTDERYEAELWLDVAGIRGKPEETEVSLTNTNNIYLNAMRQQKPPWFAKFAY